MDHNIGKRDGSVGKVPGTKLDALRSTPRTHMKEGINQLQKLSSDLHCVHGIHTKCNFTLHGTMMVDRQHTSPVHVETWKEVTLGAKKRNTNYHVHTD